MGYVALLQPTMHHVVSIVVSIVAAYLANSLYHVAFVYSGAHNAALPWIALPIYIFTNSSLKHGLELI